MTIAKRKNVLKLLIALSTCSALAQERSVLKLWQARGEKARETIAKTAKPAIANRSVSDADVCTLMLETALANILINPQKTYTRTGAVEFIRLMLNANPNENSGTVLEVMYNDSKLKSFMVTQLGKDCAVAFQTGKGILATNELCAFEIPYDDPTKASAKPIHSAK